jgi:hypothetical protein
MPESYDCGHGCKVTCPDGGGCGYSRTSGKCMTWCEPDDPKFNELSLTPASKIDLSLRDFSVARLERILKALVKAAGKPASKKKRGKN